MKKVGIMSMQRVKNYGSFLQAFATKKIIELETNSTVELVDFHSLNGIKDPAKESLDKTKKNKIKYYSMLILYKVMKTGMLKTLYKNEKYLNIYNLFSFYELYCNRFSNEFWKLLGLTSNMNYNPNLDCLVIGSDEVFNYAEANKVGYSDELFGKNNNASKLISFSGSFGCTRYDDLKSLNAINKVSGYLNNFDYLSVRDKNSQSIIKELIGRESQYHLDPVFHFDYTKYMPKIAHERPYIAVYAYTGLSEEYINVIKKIANQENLDILCFMGFQNKLGKFMNVSPFELLSYMKNASYIVTTTFHGSVFSIKYNKKFCAIVQHREGNGYGNDEKLGDLITRVKLNDHMIDSPDKLISTLKLEIDYDRINEYISKSVQEGIEYLKSSINQEK